MAFSRPDPALLAALEQLLRERHSGAARAVTGRELVEELRERGVPVGHLRRVGEGVATLRARGVPVASSSARPAGYYLLDDARQAGAVVRELDAKISGLFRARRAFKRAAAAATTPQLELAIGGT